MESFADMLGLARAYVRAGLSIIPVSPGTKIPAGGLLPLVFNEQKDREESSWKMFQERLPTEQELQRWFERG